MHVYVHLQPVTRVVDPETRDCPRGRILLVVQRVGLPQNVHTLTNL